MGWQPHGAPPTAEGSQRHPNYWFALGGIGVAWVCVFIFDPLQAFRIVLPYDAGFKIVAPLPLGLSALLLTFLLLFHLLGTRPAFAIQREQVVVTNPLTRWFIPLVTITKVDDSLGFARIHLKDGTSVICWGLERYTFAASWELAPRRTDDNQRLAEEAPRRIWEPPHLLDVLSSIAAIVYIVTAIVRSPG